MNMKVRCGQRNWWGVHWHFLLFLPGDSCLHLHLLQLAGLLRRHLCGSTPRGRHQPFLLLLHICRHCPCRHHICCACCPRNQREEWRRVKTTLQMIWNTKHKNTFVDIPDLNRLLIGWLAISLVWMALCVNNIKLQHKSRDVKSWTKPYFPYWEFWDGLIKVSQDEIRLNNTVNLIQLRSCQQTICPEYWWRSVPLSVRPSLSVSAKQPSRPLPVFSAYPFSPLLLYRMTFPSNQEFVALHTRVVIAGKLNQ